MKQGGRRDIGGKAQQGSVTAKRGQARHEDADCYGLARVPHGYDDHEVGDRNQHRGEGRRLDSAKAIQSPRKNRPADDVHRPEGEGPDLWIVQLRIW